MSDKIGEALRFDALAEAERLTGQSYKTDEETSMLGLGLHLRAGRIKENLLRESDDSYFSMDFEDQMNLFLDMGFSAVWREHFTDTNDAEETYVILWHPDGLLATMESYNGDGRNSAKVMYNYKHKDGFPGWKLISSGRLRDDDVWVGDHDACEGIRYNLDALRAEGEFLPVWVERPWLWLLNYAEQKVEGYDYNEINERKIAQLPEHVRRAITPKVG